MPLTQSPALNIESLKLHLIQNRQLPETHEQFDSVSFGELIEYLVDSLTAVQVADAHGPVATKAEALLVRIGKTAIPYLLTGLKSPHLVTRSVCAMALIRIGHASVEPLKAFYQRYHERSAIHWVVELILAELGTSLPAIHHAEESNKVLALSKAG